MMPKAKLKTEINLCVERIFGNLLLILLWRIVLVCKAITERIRDFMFLFSAESNLILFHQKNVYLAKFEFKYFHPKITAQRRA